MCLRINLGCFILIYLITAFTHTASAQYQSGRFKHIGIKDGLSQSRVGSIVQDPYGFMWFSTQDGLNRYDGYNIIQLNKDETGVELTDNFIIELYADYSDTTLWVGTINGVLHKIDLKSGRINSYTPNESIYSGSHYVRTVRNIDKNRLLVAYYEDGVYIFEKESGAFQQLIIKLPQISRIQSVLIFDESKFWIGTEDGTIIYDQRTQEYRLIGDTQGLSIRSLIRDGEQILAGSNNGLIQLDLTGNIIARFYLAKLGFRTFQGKSINTLFIDHKHSLWVGTLNSGAL